MTDPAIELERRTSNWVAGAAVVVFLVDLVTKIWAVAALDDRTIDVVWKLRLLLVSNTGFAFSTGQGLGPWLGLVAIVIAVLLWRMRHQVATRYGAAAVGMVIGGAVGNLVDRLFRGEAWGRGGVVDFIDFQFWPVFNVADTAIVLGMAALALHFWNEDRRRQPAGADA